MRKPRLLYWLTPKTAIIAAVTVILLQLSFLLLRDHSILFKGADSADYWVG